MIKIPSFVNPDDISRRVHMFADRPHLLKLARNHFLDKGFILRSGETVDKSTVQQLLDKQQGDLEIAFRTTQHHLDVSKSQRQKVKTAAQLFSISVLKALLYSGENSLIPGNWKSTAEFLELLNKWFDIFNSSFPYVKEKGKRAHGVEEDWKSNILNAGDNVVENMRGAGCKFKLPFQNGILMNNSLKNLFSDLKTQYKVRYLLTCKVNQDFLEKKMSSFIGLGHTNDHPTPQDFMHRLRSDISGKHTCAVFTLYQKSEMAEETDIQTCPTAHMLQKIAEG
ncbi:hypothetical protein PR048_032316 [Dryococelus australis]|uniref:Transposable element P transposase-like GTP-binding insertion domain-containing protein n=1 Tax=Dryococelus australis TaxID=614101 RepID=A0ABQ9G528_9NEOP|nr:hypothetical protein PR048_032316 [Dryococelus australis]